MQTALVLDLDDSLARTDLLWEQLVWLVVRRPWLIFLAPTWLLRGKANLKKKLADLSPIEVDSIPLNEGVVALARKAHSEGREIWLASASEERWVKAMAQRLAALLGTRSDQDVRWLGTTSTNNLKGPNKLRALEHALQGRAFEYVGDSWSDLEIWKGASKAWVVEPSLALWRRVQSTARPSEPIGTVGQKPVFSVLLRQLRIHQWSKNGLIFFAPLAGHTLFQQSVMLSGLQAFIAFSALASLVYLVNDLVDLRADRLHPSKRRRPLASGQLSVKWALLGAPILAVVVVLASVGLSTEAQIWLVIYVLANLVYNWKAKSIPILDVIFLASFYTTRMVFGAAAAATPLSEWILSFSTFFFFSLALAKRYTELLKAGETTRRYGRGYQRTDTPVVLALGVGSALLSILVLMLYFSSPKVQQLYAVPSRLWLVLPLQLYWFGKLWITASRGELNDDPVIYALKDRASWGVAILSALVGLSAMGWVDAL